MVLSFENILNGTSENPSWIDLPANRLLKYIPDVINDEKLTALITAYNNISKDDIESFDKRGTALMQVASYIQTHVIEGSVSDVLTDIQTTALQKRAYLRKLEQLYATGILTTGEGIYDPEKVRSYFEDFKSLPEKQAVLSNEMHYDSKNARFWGEYWLEVIDPCHRPLEHYKEQWLQEKSARPFFLWLETHEVSPYHKCMKFLTEDELREHELTIKDSLIYKADKKLTTDDHDENLLVITQEGRVISYPAGNYLRHVSGTAGKPVLGGGALKTENGVLTEIHCTSGHYLLNEGMAYQMLIILKRKGGGFN